MLLEKYSREFVNLTTSLIEKNNAVLTDDYIIVEKDFLETMLKKYAYVTVQQKLKIWKSLHWIQTEKGRFVKRKYDRETGKYKSLYFIERKVFNVMKSLMILLICVKIPL